MGTIEEEVIRVFTIITSSLIVPILFVVILQYKRCIGPVNIIIIIVMET